MHKFAVLTLLAVTLAAQNPNAVVDRLLDRIVEREKAFLFASQEGRFLWHIDEALRRLFRSPETFGRCHNCGEEIAYERLDALPHARYCIACKQREEDGKR